MNRWLLTPMLLAAGVPCAASLKNVTCELIGPGRYRLDYLSSPDTGPVEVFASSKPDRIDSAAPIVTIQRAPVEISVPGRSGRVYFHLKPAFGPARVVSIRRLPLEGASNFRDLGGYRTTDGRYVRWGTVYRSNDLFNLTANDYKYLAALGIRLVCDVRPEGERMRSPTHWKGPLPEFLNTPVGHDRDVKLTAEEDLRERMLSLAAEGQNPVQGYDRYALEYAAEYGRILRRLAAGDVPLLEHCGSGKDRTGVFSAILLTALGVPRDTVIQDFLLTGKYALAADSIEKTTADLQRILGLAKPPDVSTVRTLMTTRSEKIEATLDSIIKTHGSFGNYLRDGLNISDSELAMLRERLLEP